MERLQRILKKRGDFTLLIDEKLLREWKSINVRNKVVGEKTYTDSMITFCLVIGSLYHQILHQTTGLVASILSCNGLADLVVPNFSTLSRREGSLSISISSKIRHGKTIHLVADSTGLKSFGEETGLSVQWKVRKQVVNKCVPEF